MSVSEPTSGGDVARQRVEALTRALEVLSDGRSHTGTELFGGCSVRRNWSYAALKALAELGAIELLGSVGPTRRYRAKASAADMPSAVEVLGLMGYRTHDDTQPSTPISGAAPQEESDAEETMPLERATYEGLVRVAEYTAAIDERTEATAAEVTSMSAALLDIRAGLEQLCAWAAAIDEAVRANDHNIRAIDVGLREGALRALDERVDLVEARLSAKLDAIVADVRGHGPRVEAMAAIVVGDRNAVKDAVEHVEKVAKASARAHDVALREATKLHKETLAKLSAWFDALDRLGRDEKSAAKPRRSALAALNGTGTLSLMATEAEQ